ncbi:MAG: hypothetical protein LBG68_03195, partial [Coriobacteriales bacterium]|nr:hypothetical protein [Coriobacteriales bacterium]
ARIATDFVRRSIEVLEEGHAVCGGPRPVVLELPDPWQETLLAAEVSVFGASAAGYRRLQPAHSARSVFHGAYRRQVFEQVGKYDTRLQRTEDNDMSQRIRKVGFQIYFDPRIRSEQYLRPSLAGMLRQKAANGYWIGRTIWLKPLAVSFMHLVPLLFVSAVIAGLLLGFFLNWLPLIALAAVYLLASLFFSVLAIVRASDSRLSMLALPVIFLLLHLAYGFSTLGGLLHGYCRPIYRSFVPSKPSDQKS